MIFFLSNFPFCFLTLIL
uniref:Uncharacterized protein n=1 Tax=Anguilla anguilla TaxID=7936 RepID=A0A0E9VXT8_ANGAN